MNQFINIVLASPIGYDMKHIYRIETYTCINFNEKNSKKWCIAIGLRSNKKIAGNKCYTAAVLTAQGK